VSEANLYRLPDPISYEEGAILDMEVWAALRKCGVRAGDLAVVIGDGRAGMLACQVLRIMGARRVILSGKSESRLAKAETLRLADVCLPDVEIAKRLRAEGNGHGADLVADCVGTESSAAQAIAVAAPGGRVLFYGVYPGVLSHFDLNQVVLKDLAVFGGSLGLCGLGRHDRLGVSAQAAAVHPDHSPIPARKCSTGLSTFREKADGTIKAVLTLL
jgi:threonine dehydrogenase-like Zn-dependent dehydrogenase